MIPDVKSPSRRSRSVVPFLVMDILERARAMEHQGLDIVHMEVGEPDLPTPRIAVEAGIQALRAGRTRYTASPGLPELREAVAHRLGAEHETHVDPSRVSITVGSSAALLLAFSAITEPGDDVIISDPGYPCYASILMTLGVVPRRVPIDASHGFTLDPDRVRSEIGPRTAAIVVNSPANPTGAVTSGAVLKELCDLGPRIVSDEIYQGLTYEGPAPSMLGISEDAYVVGGFSKRYAMTGWRVGYLVAPPAHQATLNALQQNLFISAPEPGQLAALAALGATEEIEAMRRTYAERRSFLIQRLESIGLPVPVRPSGAFYVFADARRYSNDSMAMCLDMLTRAHVAITPGIDFGPGGQGWIRLSYATGMERLAEGIRRLHGYLEEM